MKKKPRTPFPTTGYYGPAYFCDRKEELTQLKRNVSGGNSTTLVARRRLGKTALIRHLFHKLRKEYITLYLDILPTESLNDLLNQFSTTIAGEINEHSSLGKRIWKILRSLRPTISYDALQGNPVISISSTPELSRKSIGELFSMLDAQPLPVIIAIDEFQQILEYPEKNTDAWLRSVIQNLKNVNFIFAGSQQHLMQELFTNPGRPFYRSTQFMKIGKIPLGIYRDFILKKFNDQHKIISPETADEMLNWTDGHTYYVQLLCNRVYLLEVDTISSEHWKDEASKILKEQEFAFFSYREMLTKPQWNLLRAIARDGIVHQPTSSDFINRHQLGSPATVLRSLKSIQRMELIYRDSDHSGTYFYGIYDLLFRRWIDRAV